MAQRQHGVIKSYGLKRGFGFITSDELPGEEIFFCNKALPRDVVEAFAERAGMQLPGKQVTFSLTHSETGQAQATEVALTAVEGEQAVGKVKSYNSWKGFGFVSSSSAVGDIFFSKKDLPAACQDMQLQNANVKFKLTFAPDGKPQAKELYPQALLAMTAMPWGLKGGGDGQAGAGLLALPAPGGWTACGGKGGWTDGGGGGWTGGGGGGGDRPMHGTVKSFDPGRGFGFILTPEIGRDVYFQGQGHSFSAGDCVSFYLNYTPDGKPQARNVTTGFADGQGCQGTVKSYNPVKGFGFLQVPDTPGDVYFKKSCLPPFLQDEDLTGRMASFTVHLAPDGKPQVQQMDIIDGQDQATGGKKRPAPQWAAEGAPPAKRVKMDMTGGTELEGIVKSYNLANGWGFIRCPTLPQDIYFKANCPEATPGLSVKFNLAYTLDGKPQANTLRF